jgi:hypothetical protein
MRKQLAQLWQHRTGVLWLLVVLVAAVALVLSVAGRLDVASFILTVAVLLITSLALQAAWLTPARLVLERQRELRHTADLMFWTYNQPDVPEGLLPAEAKLEMYMAVANVGGRKALLLGLSLEDYLDALASRCAPLCCRRQCWRMSTGSGKSAICWPEEICPVSCPRRRCRLSSWSQMRY